MSSPVLTIELVPDTAWWSNVRSNISRKDWEKCKTFVRERSGNKCEICGGVGPKHPIECHEVWFYGNEPSTGDRVQMLVDLIALCPDCHRVKHIGRTSEVGGLHALDRAIQHLCQVNNWSPETAEHYIQYCFRVHTIRSRHTWKLDVSYLALLDIDIPKVRDRA